MTKQFPLRFPLALYRRVSAASGVSCISMTKWICDACERKLQAMPVQIPQRMMDRNPVEVPPPAPPALDDATTPRILKPLF